MSKRSLCSIMDGKVHSSVIYFLYNRMRIIGEQMVDLSSSSPPFIPSVLRIPPYASGQSPLTSIMVNDKQLWHSRPRHGCAASQGQEQWPVKTEASHSVVVHLDHDSVTLGKKVRYAYVKVAVNGVQLMVRIFGQLGIQ